jgi:hypothetical protein
MALEVGAGLRLQRVTRFHMKTLGFKYSMRQHVRPHGHGGHMDTWGWRPHGHMGMGMEATWAWRPHGHGGHMDMEATWTHGHGHGGNMGMEAS